VIKKISSIFIIFSILIQAIFLSMAQADISISGMFLDGEAIMENERLFNWIKHNVSSRTQLPYSFYVSKEHKKSIYEEIGPADSLPAIIERMILEEGLEIYDGAVSTIVLAMAGGEGNLKLASLPTKIYWKGRLGELHSIRAGYGEQPFIYDPEYPSAVSSDISKKGKRGFIFRIINANGKYNSQDPLDGKKIFAPFPNWPTVHWEDWKPIAGENAWVAMAALHVYHKKHYNQEHSYYENVPYSVDLQLAEELARAALYLQAETGGIRMAPLGTYRNPEDLDQYTKQGAWWYNQISTENNISWHAAFRMLYEITQKSIYKEAMDEIELFFQAVWNPEGQFFYQGIHFTNGQWYMNDENFALDVQAWSLSSLGPEKIDDWFGEGTAFRLWQTAKTSSGFFDHNGTLQGVGFIREHDRICVEWTGGAILAARNVASYYREKYPSRAREAFKDAEDMRAGIEFLRKDFSHDKSAYAYSSKRGWIPFGWFSHPPEVMSLVATSWVILIDAGINPFFLDNRHH